MKHFPRTTAASLATALDEWFQQEGKVYPWRETQDPYAILVSEMMLQQTQISTVLGRGYYHRWMEKFPDVATLAQAEDAEILRTWEGLGYYRRARFLKQVAQEVMTLHGGLFPKTPAHIKALPGVGAYTAGAVASFAFDLREPLVDGNIARVLSRIRNDYTPIDSREGQKRLWEQATELLTHAVSPRRHNSALMELGQTICRPKGVGCDICPAQPWCEATAPLQLPVKSKKVEITAVTERVYFQSSDRGVVLVQEAGQRRTGLWKLPALPDGLPSHPPVLHHSRYTITRYKVDLWVHEPPADVRLEGIMIPHEKLADLPMPSPYRRALNALLMQGTPFTLSHE